MSYFLSKSVTRIGRERDNDIAIPHDPQVSRYHAEIRREGGVYVLYDLNSTNGTFVNNRQITSHPLAKGDQIRIGGARLTWQGNSLLLSGGAVVSSGRPSRSPDIRYAWPVAEPGRDSTTAVIAVVAVLLLVVALVAVIVLANRPGRPTTAEQIASGWVVNNTSQIADQVTAGAMWEIPLERSVLYDKVLEQVADSNTWAYQPPEKVTEGIYRVQATAAFAIPMTMPMDSYSITAVYVLTIDINQGRVKEVTIPQVTVRRGS